MTAARAVAAGSAAALGKTASKVSGLGADPSPDELEAAARRHRFELRRLLWGKLYRVVKGYAPQSVDARLPDGRHWTAALPADKVVWSRVSLCGRHTRGGWAEVHLAPGAGPDAKARAGFGALVQCGSVWACPVCAARIMAVRTTELTTLVQRHLGHETGAAMPTGRSWHRPDRDATFVTLTIRHQWGNSLAAALRMVRRAWRRFLQGRAWQLLKAQHAVTGYVVRLETTHGPNGWHPHLHALFLHDTKLAPGALDELRTAFYTRWATIVAQLDGRAVPTWEHGVDVRAGSAGAAAYLQSMKLAMELTGSDGKLGRTRAHRSPFQILADHAESGSPRDWALFREYVDGTRGARQLTWSRGLKRRYAIGEVGDEEAAAMPEPEARTIVNIEAEVYARLTRIPGALARVLDAAERGGAEAVELEVFTLVRPEYLREAELIGPPPWMEAAPFWNPDTDHWSPDV